MKQTRLLTQEQHDYLVEHIPGRYNKDLADLINDKFGLNLTAEQIRAYRKNHKLVSSGLTGRFEKGRVPINKGTKGMFNVGGNKGSFKKGQKPKNYKPVGTERIDRDGYILIKVQDHGTWNQRWRHKSRILWEQAFGQIPKHHALIFKDGNPLNCVLDNLMLVTKNELARMNQMKLKRTSTEETQVMHTLAKIKIRKAEINKRK